LAAIVLDTAYYSGPSATRSFGVLYNHVRNAPVITPLNNLLYNTQTSNLAQHGLHPHYQHLLVNLPQLLGPALVLLLASAYPFNMRVLKNMLGNIRISSAITGTLLLSVIPHQEPRFLLPTVPLLLTCIRTPSTRLWNRIFWVTWTVFNLGLAILMGVYHQGGVVPTQIAIPSLVTQSIKDSHSTAHNVEVFWWKTYPPPNFLLGAEPSHPASNRSLNISTVPLMGFPQSELVFMLMQHMPTCDPSLIERLVLHKEKTDIFVVAPLAAWRLDTLLGAYPPASNFSFSVAFDVPPAQLTMTNIFTYRRHLNLDDVDFGDDGVGPTLERVVGRRGLGVWKVDRHCGPVVVVDKHNPDALHSVTAEAHPTRPSTSQPPQSDESPSSSKQLLEEKEMEPSLGFAPSTSDPVLDVDTSTLTSATNSHPGREL
jgi:phosphatidylinositol glycan class Z